MIRHSKTRHQPSYHGWSGWRTPVRVKEFQEQTTETDKHPDSHWHSVVSPAFNNGGVSPVWLSTFLEGLRTFMTSRVKSNVFLLGYFSLHVISLWSPHWEQQFRKTAKKWPKSRWECLDINSLSLPLNWSHQLGEAIPSLSAPAPSSVKWTQSVRCSRWDNILKCIRSGKWGGEVSAGERLVLTSLVTAVYLTALLTEVYNKQDSNTSNKLLKYLIWLMLWLNLMNWKSLF